MGRRIIRKREGKERGKEEMKREERKGGGTRVENVENGREEREMRRMRGGGGKSAKEIRKKGRRSGEQKGVKKREK